MPLPNPNPPNPTDWPGRTPAPEEHPYIDVDLPGGLKLRVIDVARHVHENVVRVVNSSAPANLEDFHGSTIDTGTAWRPDRDKWLRYIILHHSGGGTVGSEDNPDRFGIPFRVYQVCRESGRRLRHMAYHYAIYYHPRFVDGEPDRMIVYKTQDLRVASSHLGLQRRTSIGIHFPGKYRGYAGEGAIPSDFQYNALRALLVWLQSYYSIANEHVQGHFSHSKAACPEYDLERLIIHNADTARAFAYPLHFGGATALRRTGSDPRGAVFLENNGRLGHGLFPFSRQRVWHNGIHLRPPAEQSPVQCVRDGWVIAARIGGNVEIDGFDHGSPNFVLVQHCDAGIHRSGKWLYTRSGSGGDPRWVRHMSYYSLYMHLASHEEAGEPSWLQRLREMLQPETPAEGGDEAESAEPTLYDLLLQNRPVAFGNLALPVKTGEIIGHTGLHNPYAILHQQPQSLLHVEMFSTLNLVAQHDPDFDTEPWTYQERRPMDDPRTLPEELDGLNADDARYKTHSDMLENGPAGAPDYPQLDPILNDELSKCIVGHISEWTMDWSDALDELEAANPPQLTAEQRTAFESYLDEMQWLRQLLADDQMRENLQLSTNWLHEWRVGNARTEAEDRASDHLGWPRREQLFYFYHPIRLLHWLNGMTRTLDDVPDYPDGLPYKSAPGVYPSAEEIADMAPRIESWGREYKWRWIPNFQWDDDLV